MPSVAGQIRIDTMAYMGQFVTGMRQGGRDGFGAFKEEAAKFDQWYNSRKSIAERAKQEAAAWRDSMKSLRGEVYSGVNRFKAFGAEWQSLEGMDVTKTMGADNRTRWKDMLPFGTSMRTEISREAAETAAAIGAAERRIGDKLMGSAFGPGIRSAVGGVVGHGPVGRVIGGSLAELITPATLGVGATAGPFIAMQAAAASLGDEIRKTRQEANEMGKTFDQLQKERGGPAYSPTVEGGALAASIGKEKAKGFFGKIWSGTKELAAGAYGGMIGGMAGTNIGTMADDARATEEGTLWIKRFREEVARIDADSAKAQKGLEPLRRELDIMKRGSAAVARDEFIKQYIPDDNQLGALREFDRITADIAKRKALKGGEGMAQSNLRNWQSAMYGDDFMRAQAYRDQVGGYMNPDEIEANIRLFEKRDAEAAGARRADSTLSSLQTPEERRDQALADADAWRQGNQDRMGSEEKYQRLRQKAHDDYMKQLQQERDAEKQNRDATRARLGIRDPLGDYQSSLADLDSAYKSGKYGIGKDDYDKAKKRLRDRAVGEMAGDQPQMVPAAAMAAGSREAHSLITQAMIGDPKMRIAQDTLRKLDAIDKKQGEQVEATRELVRALKE